MSADAIIVAGTDTGVGKTVFSAALMLALDAVYWKPIQAGVDADGGTDTERARRMTGLPAERFLPEAYRLGRPLSPHRAAELDGVSIDPSRLVLPRTGRPLVVEAAGGLMVPLTRSLLQVDLLARWGAPVILCARTTLGTINHSLLSIEALRRRGVPLLGVAFVGGPQPDSERTIAELGGARRLGRLPLLERLAPSELLAAFAENFRREDYPRLEAAA